MDDLKQIPLELAVAPLHQSGKPGPAGVNSGAPEESCGTGSQGIPGDEGEPESTPQEEAEPRRWSPEDECVVLREQLAIRVYENLHGNVIIMRERQWPDEDADPYISITPESLPALIAALKQYAPR
jgi:hypothetical protein